jgi:sporulation protein YlmC with PRC-barrel domain
MGFHMTRLRLAALCGLFALLPTLAYAEDALAPVALNSLSEPPKLSSKPVLDQQGHVVGQVAQLATDQDGKPSALSIRAAKDGSIVVVSAAAVSYDGHTLVTSSDQPQIAALQPQRTAAAQ